MAVRDRILEKLAAAFAPQRLEVIDESAQHAGHAGHRPGGETHIRIRIVAEAFRGAGAPELHVTWGIIGTHRRSSVARRQEPRRTADVSSGRYESTGTLAAETIVGAKP